MPIKPKLVPVGASAPDFTLPRTDGATLTLSDYRGNACVVLVFLRGFQ